MSFPALAYALPRPSFPFRHLAAYAGRAPIGGSREVALACFVAARLAAEVGAGERPDDEARVARSAAAKSWLATLTLPAPVRGPLTRCLDAAARDGAAAMAREVGALEAACAAYLDAPSRADLKGLAELLSGRR